MQKHISKLSRRSVLVGMAGSLAAPMVLRSSRAAAKSDTVNFVSWGGSYQEYIEKAVTKRFTEETGINVNIIPGPDLAKIKAMQLTNNVEIDIWDDQGPGIATGSKEGLWDTLDHSVFDLPDLAIPPASDSVAWTMWAGGIAWDPQKFGAEKHPATFAEYWNLDKFPGRRLMREWPYDTMEMALLADGVAPNDIYPLDLDRAFKVLDRIKPSVASWVNSATQTVSLLQTGEVDFSYSYAHRVKRTTEPEGGKPLAFSFDQNLLTTERLALIKGAPNKENAMKLIAYFLKPDVQVRLIDNFGSAPVSKGAVPKLSEQSRKWQPKLDSPNNLIINDEYWAENMEAVSLRLKQWIQT